MASEQIGAPCQWESAAEENAAAIYSTMCDAVSTACWFALLSFDALALPQESDAMRA